jgi:hypothetical protein
MRLEIQGKEVEVDDNFANLSPEDQQKTVNEIAGHMSSGATDNTTDENSASELGGMALGAAGAAGKLIASHPIASAAIGAAVPGVNKLPGLSQLHEFGSNAIDALHNYNLNNMADTIRKGERFGQDMSQLKQVYNQKVAAMGGANATPIEPLVSPNSAVAPTAAPQTAAPPVRPVMPQTAPMTPPPPTSPMAPPTSQNYLSRMAAMARQYGPALEDVGRGLAKWAAPAMIAKELMYTSPEEIATLKEAEAKRRAAGWKPLNER